MCTVHPVGGGICCIITYAWVFIYELFSTTFRLILAGDFCARAFGHLPILARDHEGD